MMVDIMGFGLAPGAPVPLADPELAGSAFRASLLLVADGLGAEIERFDHHREVAVASAPVTATFGRIDTGTVSAQRFSCTAVVGGRRALTIEHITRVGADQAPDWPTGRGWRVVEGEPSMILDATIAIHAKTTPGKAASAPPCTPSTPSPRRPRHLHLPRPPHHPRTRRTPHPSRPTLIPVPTGSVRFLVVRHEAPQRSGQSLPGG